MRSVSHRNRLTTGATTCAVICISVSLPTALQADTILYNNGTVNGTLWANGSITIDQLFRTPENKPSIKFTSSETYANGGINFYGVNAPLTVPSDETTLRATIYSDDASMNGFAVRMSTGDQNFDSTNGTWLLNGNPGQTKDFTTGQWHTLEFDLSSQPNFKRGITQLQNDGVTFKVNETGVTVYIADLRLTDPNRKAEADVDIPEPASFTALISLGTLTIVSRRKSRK